MNLSVFSPRDYRIALLLALAALLLGLLDFQVELGSGGDEAEYLLLGRTLATGQGYRQVNDPAMPVEAKRPPGYPALVALSYLAFGETYVPLQILSLASYALAVALAYLLLILSCVQTRVPQHLIHPLCIGSSVFFLFNAEALRLTSLVAPDIGFAMVAFAALLAMELLIRSRSPRRWMGVAGIGAVVAATLYLRPTAIVLIPALLLFIIARRSSKLGIAFLLPALIIVGPWVYQQRQQAHSGRYTYVGSTLTSGDLQPPSSSGIAALPDPHKSRLEHLASVFARRAVKNLGVYTLKTGQVLLPRPDSLRPQPQVNIVADTPGAALMTHAPANTSSLAPQDTDASASPHKRPSLQRIGRYVLGVLALLGGCFLALRGLNSGHWYVLLTFALLLVMPYNVTRYLVPLLPLLAFYLLWLITRPLPPRLQTATILALCALPVLFTVPGLAQRVLWNLQYRDLPANAAERYGLDGSDVVNHVRAAEWIAANTPANAVIVCRKPYTMYFLSGRHSLRTPTGWPPTADAVELDCQAAARYGPVYLIEDGFGDRFPFDADTCIRPAIREHRDAFEEVWRAAGPRTVVWRLASPESLTPIGRS